MRNFVTLFLLVSIVAPTGLFAKAKRKLVAGSAPNPAYVAALAAANHFLRAWQTGDIETGIMLLTDPARRQSSEDKLRQYFSAPLPRGFEIHRGRRLRAGRYSFPIVLLDATDARHARRRYSEVLVVNTGTNDWAIDKLP